MRMVVNPNSSTTAPTQQQVQQLPPYNNSQHHQSQQQHHHNHHHQQQQQTFFQNQPIAPMMSPTHCSFTVQTTPIHHSSSSACSTPQYPLSGVAGGYNGGAGAGGADSSSHSSTGYLSSGAVSRNYSNVSSVVTAPVPHHSHSGSSSPSDHSASVSSADEIFTGSIRPPPSVDSSSNESSSTYRKVTRQINPYNKEAPWVVVSSAVVPKRGGGGNGSLSGSISSMSSSFKMSNNNSNSSHLLSSPITTTTTSNVPAPIHRSPMMGGSGGPSIPPPPTTMNLHSTLVVPAGSNSSASLPPAGEEDKMMTLPGTTTTTSTSTPAPMTKSIIPTSPTTSNLPTGSQIAFTFHPQDSQVKHSALAESGTVPFVSFDEIVLHREVNERLLLSNCSQRKGDLQRLFLGQLPYDVTPKMVTDICLAVTGRPVLMAETITKRDPKTGILASTGCSHAYCRHEDTEHILSIMNKMILVDVNGIWVAQNEAQSQQLKSYVSKIKKDTTKRFPGLPVETVVAQVATSSYKGRSGGNNNPSAPSRKHVDVHRQQQHHQQPPRGSSRFTQH